MLQELLEHLAPLHRLGVQRPQKPRQPRQGRGLRRLAPQHLATHRRRLPGGLQPGLEHRGQPQEQPHGLARVARLLGPLPQHRGQLLPALEGLVEAREPLEGVGVRRVLLQHRGEMPRRLGALLVLLRDPGQRPVGLEPLLTKLLGRELLGGLLREQSLVALPGDGPIPAGQGVPAHEAQRHPVPGIGLQDPFEGRPRGLRAVQPLGVQGGQLLEQGLGLFGLVEALELALQQRGHALPVLIPRRQHGEAVEGAQVFRHSGQHLPVEPARRVGVAEAAAADLGSGKARRGARPGVQREPSVGGLGLEGVRGLGPALPAG